MFLYLSTNLPRLNSLDRFHSLFYNINLKHGMIQIRLLDHPSKLSSYPNWDRHCPLEEIWDLCIIKAEHIWTFEIQSWNMKPIGIGIQQDQYTSILTWLKPSERKTVHGLCQCGYYRQFINKRMKIYISFSHARLTYKWPSMRFK